MSTTTASSLAFVSQQLVIYRGFFIFVAGLIGGPLVRIVFFGLQTFRQSSCAFYLTSMSIVNILHLFTGLLTFIMINGFGINWTNMSLFYCKFIDEKLAQHHGLPPREKKFHWSKNQPIRKSENNKRHCRRRKSPHVRP
jgi:hypothetical protein